MNIATDLIILVMPIPLILKLRLDVKRKVGLIAVFTTGVL